jgi:hypothetical protein
MSSNVMDGRCSAIKALSFLSVVRFSDRDLKRSVERLELVMGEYQDCGMKCKSLLRAGALGIMDSYSQLEISRELDEVEQIFFNRREINPERYRGRS